ncbi:hypothetical protein BN439_3497 [Erwinia amylovora Ea644]|nr:hypothetical protein BN439_3497 [Erwinia amylovora Ea644]CCP08583.1 hypothetical protein BN440_3593 [Erwinia amylovora MR1]
MLHIFNSNGRINVSKIRSQVIIQNLAFQKKYLKTGVVFDGK